MSGSGEEEDLAAAWGAAPCVGRISDSTRSRRRCAGDARLGGKGVALEHGAYYFCVIAANISLVK